MNRTIKLLMLADVFAVTGAGLIDPILAIFVNENLVGGSIFAAGVASTLYLFTKCLVQLPFSRYVDAHDNKVKWLILGTFISACVPFIYIFATQVEHMYVAQILLGIGAGLIYPTWLSLWSVNLDKRHEGFEWSLYSTLTGLGAAVTAAVGALVAQLFGFHTAFLLVGFLGLGGCAILFGLLSVSERPRKVSGMEYQKHRKLTHHKRRMNFAR